MSIVAYLVVLLFTHGVVSSLLSSESLDIKTIEGMLLQFMRGLSFVIIFSILPIVFYAVRLVIKAKPIIVKLEGLQRGEAVLSKVKTTGKRLNKEPIYEIELTLESNGYDKKDTLLRKEVRVPAYIIHYFKLNQTYPIAYDPSQNNTFYMNYLEGENWI